MLPICSNKSPKHITILTTLKPSKLIAEAAAEYLYPGPGCGQRLQFEELAGVGFSHTICVASGLGGNIGCSNCRCK